MTRLILLPLLLLLDAVPAAADMAEDLDKWFRDGYAALYAKDAWDKADQFAQYFATEIQDRGDDGFDVTDVDDFVINSLDGWHDEGWLGTDVVSLETELLNATTVVFDVRWRDRYEGGSTIDSCGWYLADKTYGKWLLSQWIATTCAE